MAVVIIRDRIGEAFWAKFLICWQVQKDIRGLVHTTTMGIIQVIITVNSHGLEPF